MKKYECPVCGCLTLEEPGGYDICPVCFWEDDGDRDPHSENGANEGLTIIQARENFLRFGAFLEKFKDKTRKPNKSEISDSYLILINNEPAFYEHG